MEELAQWHYGRISKEAEDEEELEEEEADHYLCTPLGEVLGPYLSTDVNSWQVSGMLEPGTMVSRGDGMWSTLVRLKELLCRALL